MRKINKMPPKAAQLLLVVTTSRQTDTSMAKSLDNNSQLIIRGQLQLVID